MSVCVKERIILTAFLLLSPEMQSNIAQSPIKPAAGAAAVGGTSMMKLLHFFVADRFADIINLVTKAILWQLYKYLLC